MSANSNYSMKVKKSIITDHASYEAYLNELFAVAVTTNGTQNKSINEVLLAKALSYGRAVADAKEDVKRILNVRDAVSVLLKKASATSKYNNNNSYNYE